jgi:hypothetical protein
MWPAPARRAASTYSAPRTVMTAARTTRPQARPGSGQRAAGLEALAEQPGGEGSAGRAARRRYWGGCGMAEEW